MTHNNLPFYNIDMKFIFLGDSQCSRITGKDNDYSGWQKLLRESLSMLGKEDERPLVLISGDLVNKPDNADEWQAFFDACDNVRREFDFTLVSPTGNHGRVGGYEQIDGYRERFLLTGNGPFGHEHGFFSFDYGNAHFLVLDSNYMDNPDPEARNYLGAWIKQDLAKNKQPAVFALLHHPMYSASDSFNDQEHAKAMREGYLNLLARYGVDYILCGHEHMYCRTGASAEVPQIMGVSGEKHFYAKKRDMFALIRENVVVTTFFKVDIATIELDTFSSKGEKLDHHVQSIRPAKIRNCESCSRFSRCGGTGELEYAETQDRARSVGRSPLIPASQDGIIVDGTTINPEELERLGAQERTFSVMQRGKLKQEGRFGIELEKLLPDGAHHLIVTDRRGFRFHYEYASILQAKRFVSEEDGQRLREEPAPPMLSMVQPDTPSDREERPKTVYGIVIGQQHPEEYNGRLWIDDIVEIEVVHEIS